MDGSAAFTIESKVFEEQLPTEVCVPHPHCPAAKCLGGAVNQGYAFVWLPWDYEHPFLVPPSQIDQLRIGCPDFAKCVATRVEEFCPVFADTVRVTEQFDRLKMRIPATPSSLSSTLVGAPSLEESTSGEGDAPDGAPSPAEEVAPDPAAEVAPDKLCIPCFGNGEDDELYQAAIAGREADIPDVEVLEDVTPDKRKRLLRESKTPLHLLIRFPKTRIAQFA